MLRGTRILAIFLTCYGYSIPYALCFISFTKLISISLTVSSAILSLKFPERLLNKYDLLIVKI